VNGITLPGLLVWYVVFLFSTTFHEFMHAFVAYRAGDTTAYEGGQVTLDPMPHLRRSPFGMIAWPLLSFLISGGGWMFGWASAPYDRHWADRNPTRYALMSASGPLANFLLVGVGMFAIHLLMGQGLLVLSSAPRLDSLAIAARDGSPAIDALAMALSVLVSLNVVLGVFNLLPVPPLDGFSVVEGLAPRSAAGFFQTVRYTPAYQFLGLAVAWYLGPAIIGPALGIAVGVLYAL
jgi:Zn-dependent protease